MRRREFVTAGLGALAFTGALAARAQQRAKAHRMAVAHPSYSTSDMMQGKEARIFLEELRKRGYVEGQNLTVELYSGRGQTERYAQLAAEVVSRNPDVILTFTSRMLRHFKEATATIPVVGTTADPVVLGLVPSLARPGGNLTGVVTDAGLVEIWDKRLEIVRETVPQARRVGFVVPDKFPRGLEAAQRWGITPVGLPLETPLRAEEYRRVIESMVRENADVLIVNDSAENFENKSTIIELAQQYRIPTIYANSQFVEAGGLLSYGIDNRELSLRLASVIDEILRGANPGDIPFYRASKFELIINLKTAKALGLTIPPTLLVRADEVIE
jgi:putative ABC transport system substrate-binding protein